MIFPPFLSRSLLSLLLTVSILQNSIQDLKFSVDPGSSFYDRFERSLTSKHEFSATKIILKITYVSRQRHSRDIVNLPESDNSSILCFYFLAMSSESIVA